MEKVQIFRIKEDRQNKLIDYGLKIKGLIKPPKAVIFLNDFIEIREKINYIEDYLRGK